MSNPSKYCDPPEILGLRSPSNPLLPPQANVIDVKLMSNPFLLAPHAQSGRAATFIAGDFARVRRQFTAITLAKSRAECDQPLRAPPTKPAMNSFWKAKKKARIGKEAIIIMANICP